MCGGLYETDCRRCKLVKFDLVVEKNCHQVMKDAYAKLNRKYKKLLECYAYLQIELEMSKECC